jgi:hypothetical protein
MTEHVREKLIAANDIDAALEESLTRVWDAKVYSWDNSKYPFNEWILNRVRGMVYKLDDLSYLYESVPLNETYKGTKQLCADTNLPEFRRMLNRFAGRSRPGPGAPVFSRRRTSTAQAGPT